MSSHSAAIKKLMPIELGDIATADIDLEGEMLDLARDAIMLLLPEAFPSSTEALLARWEAEYGIFPRPNADIAARRAALRAQYVTVGSLSKAHFTAIAAALGYAVDITDGGGDRLPFRAGTSKAGDRVYAAGSLWSWTVTTLNKPAGADIRDLFADLNPPHMRLEWNGA